MVPPMLLLRNFPWSSQNLEDPTLSEVITDHATDLQNSKNVYNPMEYYILLLLHIITSPMVLQKLWWRLPRKWWKIYQKRKTLQLQIAGIQDNSYLKHNYITIGNTDEQTTKDTATTDTIMLPCISTELLKNSRAADVQTRQTSRYCRICNHGTRARITNLVSGTWW